MKRAARMRVAVATTSLMLSCLLLLTGSPAHGVGYDDHGPDHYWYGTGSGGSLRCAASGFAVERQSSVSVTGYAYTSANKDLFCVNKNYVPASYIQTRLVIQEWNGSMWVTYADEWAQNLFPYWDVQVGASCSFACNGSSRLVSSHGVDSLGAWRNDLLVSATITP